MKQDGEKLRAKFIYQETPMSKNLPKKNCNLLGHEMLSTESMGTRFLREVEKKNRSGSEPHLKH